MIPDAAAEPGLEPLFLEMYAYFAAVSGRSFLNEQGYERWIASYARVAGRSRVLIGAWHDGRLAGFVEGLLRAAPAYSADGVTGFVAHLMSVRHIVGGRWALAFAMRRGSGSPRRGLARARCR